MGKVFFVSYSWSDGRNCGFGNAALNGGIYSIDDAMTAARLIEKNLRKEGVVILGWQRFDKEKKGFFRWLYEWLYGR